MGRNGFTTYAPLTGTTARPGVGFQAVPDERAAETILVHTGGGQLDRHLGVYLDRGQMTGRVQVAATSQTRVSGGVLFHKWQRRAVIDKTMPTGRYVGWWVTALQHRWLNAGQVHRVCGRPTGADRGAVWTPLYGYGRDGELLVCVLPSIPEGAEEMLAITETAAT